MSVTFPHLDPKSIQKDDHGWIVKFVFEDGSFPVYISLAQIRSWAGTGADDEEVRAAIAKRAQELGFIAQSMRRAGKKRLRL